MQNKHLNITYAYHFLSEAIILLLIATPILYLHYRWIPYWSYLMIILISCIVFSLLSRRTANYRAYLLVAIPLFIAFYLLHYWVGGYRVDCITHQKSWKLFDEHPYDDCGRFRHFHDFLSYFEST